MEIEAGVEQLRDRVAALDSGTTSENETTGTALPDRQAIIRDAGKFIGVLEDVTSNGDHSVVPIVSATDADATAATCHLIHRLGVAEPALVTREAAGYQQYWISTAKPPWVPPQEPVLAPEHLVPAARAERLMSSNPFGVGLYTSTGFQGTQGMWRIYLDLGQYSSNFLHPWHVWKLDTNDTARVYNVTTAAEWETLILRYPAVAEDLIYPDWQSIAHDWDGVHITVRAIAAIQGMRLQTAQGLLAPSYWDVETTLWLRWSFTSVTLVETVKS